MARGLFRKTSFNKMVGAYRSQWKRFWMRLFTFGMYGRKGMGWLRDPKKAWYNWWYHRTSISLPRLLGYKPSWASCFCAMLVASVVGIVAAPVDATRAGVKAHKIKTERRARATSGGSRNSGSTNRTSTGTTNRTSAGSTNRTTASSTRDTVTTPRTFNTTEIKTRSATQSSVTGNTPKKTSSASKTRTASTPKPKVTYTPPVKKDEKEKKTPTYTFTATAYSYEPIKPLTPPEPKVKEPDENTPKSKPKHEGDQYIRKRMIIAGSSYCDKSALDKLTVGTYFELMAEPSNLYDKDAVMLVHEGAKIGYIAKQDKGPFVTCLRLKRRMYGVITDIITEPYPTKYEYETWFDSERK